MVQAPQWLTPICFLRVVADMPLLSREYKKMAHNHLYSGVLVLRIIVSAVKDV